jgi:hypothetical protein
MTNQSWSAETFLDSRSTQSKWLEGLKISLIALMVYLTLTVFVVGWYAPSFAQWLESAALCS